MAYRLSCVVRKCNSMNREHFLQLSKNSTTTNFQKGVNFVKNDPFIKLSLSLCVLIAGGTFLVEVYKKFKKTTSAGVQILPFAFAHHSVKRQSLITHLHNEVLRLRTKCKDMPPVLYITGPPGSGKTELVRQFCSSYVSASKKWMGWKSICHQVLSVDATSPELLHISLAEVASSLGLQHASKNVEELFSSIVYKLKSNKLPWLLVVDDLTRDTATCFESLVSKYLSGKDKYHQVGAILITTQISQGGSTLVHKSSYSIERLSPDQSLELLEQITGLQFNDKPLISGLLQVLQYNPMAIALAAATLKINCSFLPDSERKTVIPSYQNKITQKDDLDLPAIVRLYCEAAISDSRIRHAFDFLGSCNLNFPLLVSVLPIHLGLDFYGIPDQLLAPLPLDPLLADMKSSSEHRSYWSLIKSTIPFWNSDIPSNDQIAKVLAASQDEIHFLRQSPILHFKHNWHGEFECVTVHPIARHCISNLFDSVTISNLNQDFVAKERIKFEQKSWFKNFSTFDEKRSLSKFHLMLPGLSSPGVLTQSQFNNIESNQQLNYSRYVHIVSHYHRVVLSLVSVLRSVKGEIQSIALKKCLYPHFQALQDFAFLSQRDKLSANISLVIIEAIHSANSEKFICQFEDLIAKQKLLFGVKSAALANSLVDLADLQLSLTNATSAKELLQRAIGIYEQVPVHLRHEEFMLDMGHALSSLGLAYDQLCDRTASRECYDQALATAQSVPPSGRVGVQQRKLVASLLVDVTRAYLCLGDLLVARKYSELATVMLESIYPHGHAEIVRLLNIRSIVSALLGDKSGSTKFRVEASKLKVKLDL